MQRQWAPPVFQGVAILALEDPFLALLYEPVNHPAIFRPWIHFWPVVMLLIWDYWLCEMKNVKKRPGRWWENQESQTSTQREEEGPGKHLPAQAGKDKIKLNSSRDSLSLPLPSSGVLVVNL
jgi:hypothetical protein